MISDFESFLNQSDSGFGAYQPPVVSTANSPMSIADKSPLGKFLDIASEAFSPGHVQANESAASTPTPFYNTFLGRLLDYKHDDGTRAFDQQRAQDQQTALKNYAANMPTDPIAQIQGMIKADPVNAPHYMTALMKYETDQNDPVHQYQLQQLKDAAVRKKAIADYAASLGSGSDVTQGGVPVSQLPQVMRQSMAENPAQSPAPPIDNGAMAPMAGFKDAAPLTPIQAFHDAQAQQQALTGVSPGQNAVDATNVSRETPAPPALQPTPPPLSPYQRAALSAFKANPSEETQKLYIDSLKADGETSEIKNYEYAKTHPDFVTSKTASGAMSSFRPDSPFMQAQDQGVTGDELINTVPDKNVQNKARALLRGDAPYPILSSRTPVEVKAALEVAQAADPNYSATTAPLRKQNALYYASSGEGGKILSSIKVIAKHINTMSEAQKDLNNSGALPGATLENYIVNNASRSYDNKTHSALNSMKEASNNVAPELAKVIAGKTNVAEPEIEKQRGVFSAYDGNEAFNSSAHTAAEMVAARAQTMLDNYRRDMSTDKKPPAPDFDQKTIDTFKTLGVNLEDYFDVKGGTGEAKASSHDMSALQAAAAAELARRGH